MMNLEETNHSRLIGDYILGPRIGSGSFAVVWLSRHRYLGTEVAIKEIDKKHLSHKVKDNLLKEITILSNINHPNIIRLHEAIQTVDKIYLVLEYCNGGDLAAYIHRHGRVSVGTARHFMRQLASGLQVLRQNNLIHRDLKPQNLLLLSNEATPLLKIGDFGFARYLTPQGLADTLCGSPLYMAPEIIQNQKYDAKADLWSVGAILFQIVTGKPPFDGNSPFQLFQNILTSNGLRFPDGALEELHPDIVDLCRSLLCRNPVERLTFEEFFNHKFMTDPRPRLDVKQCALLPEIEPLIEQFECLTDDKLPFASNNRSQLHLGHILGSSSNSNSKLTPSVHDVDKKILPRNDYNSRTLLSSKATECIRELIPNIKCDSQRKAVDGGQSNPSHLHGLETKCVDRQAFSLSSLRVADSLESIEKEYVLVNSHFASVETLSSSLETSMQDNSAAKVSNFQTKNICMGKVVAKQTGVAARSVSGAASIWSNVSDPSAALCISNSSVEVQRPSLLHPSNRLQLLSQYVHALSELALKKLHAGMLLESFSVELVALAVWREAVHVCRSWVTSTAGEDFLDSCSANELAPDKEFLGSFSYSYENTDYYNRSSSVSSWVEQGFIVAFDRVEKMANHIRDIDGSAEMPDAMEIIFQAALAAGKSGAVDDLMGNRSSAAVSYSKATLLLSFILGEAISLPLNPPFSLTVSDQQRIQRYIINLKVHQTCSNSPVI